MFNFISELKEIIYFQNSLFQYLESLLIFILSLIILKIIQKIIVKHLKQLALKTKTDFDDMLIEILSSIKPGFYIWISLYFSLSVLTLNNLLQNIIKFIFIITITIEIVNAIIKLIFYFLDKYLAKKEKIEGKKSVNLALINTLKFLIKLTLWSIAILMILSNLGVNVSSVIASLGIGGIAIALAAQNILSDLFSAFSIYFDRPFEIDDFIQVNNYSGTVKYIGLKTTRLESLQGEEIIISNQELTNAKIQNFKRMQKRRVSFTLGLEYNSDIKNLKEIPQFIEKIIKNAGAEFDRCFFTEFADSSLNFEIVYYVNSPDYLEYLKINDKINFDILETFKKHNLNFAYPSQSIYIEKE